MQLTSTATLLALILEFVQARRFDVPLKRRDDGIQLNGTVSFEALDRERFRLARKYQNYKRVQPNDTSSQVLTKRAADYSSLAYDGEALWTGPVTVGGQTFNCYFDTGSTDLSLASSSCTDPSCDGKARYDVAKSPTAKATTFKVQSSWAIGTSGNGLLVRDTVKIGKTAVNTQDVVAQTSIGSYVNTRAADGVVGLAFRDLSAARSYAFPFTLFQQGGSQYFAFLLSRTVGKSRIYFNGYDRKFIGPGIGWFPVAKDIDEQFRTLWQIGQSTAYVNNRQAWKGFSNFALDSGSALIIAPPDAAAEFWSAVPLSRQENDSYWSFPCDVAPKVAIVFGRQTTKKFAIDPRDFNLGPLPADPTRCVGSVIGQDLNLGDTWIIGDVFFKSYYIIFDVSQNRIGIANARILNK